MSYIQQQILSRLLKSEGLRYSEAKPVDTENDLYNYHLQFLVKKGFVKKQKEKYLLTDEGKRFVQHMDSLGVSKEYFKFSVVVYITDSSSGEWQILSHKRQRHPYFGIIYNGISGKVHPGELVENAAQRKVVEETGLVGKPRFIGVIRKIRRKQETIIEDTLYHYCHLENPSGTLVETNDFGSNFWSNYRDAKKYDEKNFTLGNHSRDILHIVHDKKFSLFYLVEDTQLQKF